MCPNTEANEQAEAKQKILIADDEASIRRILETRLSMIGYDVVTAADGEEAVDVFNKENPDLVVLDVMMPKMDGYGVCREIRRTSDVPIIILTALGYFLGQNEALLKEYLHIITLGLVFLVVLGIAVYIFYQKRKRQNSKNLG